MAIKIYETDMRGYVINDFQQADIWRLSFSHPEAALEEVDVFQGGNTAQIPDAFDLSLDTKLDLE